MPDEPETAKQFDLLALNLQLALVEGRDKAVAGLRERVVEAAGALQGVNVPLVQTLSLIHI